MEGYHKRLATERNELYEKIVKLREFFDNPKISELSNEAFNNLQIQLSIMVSYKDILDIRLFKEGKE